jgi:chromosomal replication initiation ATPase DnaA
MQTELERQQASVRAVKARIMRPVKTLNRQDFEKLEQANNELRAELSASHKECSALRTKLAQAKKAIEDRDSTIAARDRVISAYGDLGQKRHDKSAAEIVRSVLSEFPTVSFADVVSHRRERTMIRARFLCIAMVRKLRPDMSYPAIGRFFDRDHTTIMHAEKRAKELGLVE